MDQSNPVPKEGEKGVGLSNTIREKKDLRSSECKSFKS